MLNIYRRFKMAARTGEFFALHQWDFVSKNIQELDKDTSPADRRAFPVDITQVVWDTYVRDYVFGIRNYVLKDPPSTIPQALSKLQKSVSFCRLLFPLHRDFILNVYAIVQILLDAQDGAVRVRRHGVTRSQIKVTALRSFR